MIESCDTVIPERRNPSSSNRLGQWVVLSSAGGRLSVAVKISLRTSSVTVVGGGDLRARSSRPSSANRRHHNTTVGSVHPARSAISGPVNPWVDSNTIWACWTSRTAAPRSRTPPRAALRIQRADAGEAGLAKLIRAISAVLKYRRVWP